MLSLAPVPGVIVETPVVNKSITGHVTQAMRYWLLSLIDRINAGPQTVSSVSLTTQAASITTTAMPILVVLPGVYRLSMTTQVTQAATTSSSLIVTFGWTSGVACTLSSAAMTGNTLATTTSLSAIIRVSNATTITYATTYASVGATTMQYQLDVVCEQLL